MGPDQRRPWAPEGARRWRGAETRRRGCRLDGKLMFTAESAQRFQGEGRRAGRAGREPEFHGAHGGAEARQEGAAAKVAARAGPTRPTAAVARDPPGAGEETRQVASSES